VLECNELADGGSAGESVAVCFRGLGTGEAWGPRWFRPETSGAGADVGRRIERHAIHLALTRVVDIPRWRLNRQNRNNDKNNAGVTRSRSS
jgi:hypothetical protein